VRPLVASVRPRPAPAAAPVAGPLRHGRLLVVDDNRDAADATVALLQLLGWDAIGRYDGASALDLLGTTSFQLALLDLGMPGMDGFELARAIRATQRTPPVLVALTGWGQAADRAASREAGFDAHLVKPVSVASLEAVLAEHLGSTA
jgi:CheY-like chemotaxis protein